MNLSYETLGPSELVPFGRDRVPAIVAPDRDSEPSSPKVKDWQNK